MRQELALVSDKRVNPRIPTMRVVAGLFFMVCVRIGSLNGIEEALKKCPRHGRWHQWMGGELPSADRLGEVAALFDLDTLRACLHKQYSRQKRNKAIQPLPGGLFVLILDGHEGFSSYLRDCPDCLQREVKHGDEKRIQYYHRHVMAYLLHAGGRMLLDLEFQNKGEGEIAAAMRLLKRLFRRYPRAFNLVAGDALYLDPTLCQLIIAHGKDFIAVLKNENRDLIKDFRGLLPKVESLTFEYGRKQCVCQDIEGFTSWTQFGHELRVVRSEETSSIQRQRTKEVETMTTEWLWATSLTSSRAGTKIVIRIGHGRWEIENQGFNELGKYWHADHMYHHDVNAIAAILLLIFLAYNLFHIWIDRGLKPQLRARHSIDYFYKLIVAQFYNELSHPT